MFIPMTINKLLEAQKFAMSNRPEVGGFPYLAEVLRQAGVKSNIWSLPSCQSIYVMEDGNVVQQGNPLVSGTHEISKFDQDALIKAIRKDQAGNSTFLEFLQSAWEAGVIGYEVDFIARKVTYIGVNWEKYIEEYPAFQIIL